MAQRPQFMHSGVNKSHHEQAMDDLSKQIHFLTLLNHEQQERIRMERAKTMLFMMQNTAPNRYLLPPCFRPIQHNYMQIGPCQLPVWLPKSKGTGAFIPDYDGECSKYNGIMQHKPQTKRAKAGVKKEKKDTVSCHTSPEVLLPKEWTY